MDNNDSAMYRKKMKNIFMKVIKNEKFAQI